MYYLSLMLGAGGSLSVKPLRASLRRSLMFTGNQSCALSTQPSVDNANELQLAIGPQ
jgi:hypothetical protein